MDDYTFNVIYKCWLILLCGRKQVYYCIIIVHDTVATPVNNFMLILKQFLENKNFLVTVLTQFHVLQNVLTKNT